MPPSPVLVLSEPWRATDVLLVEINQDQQHIKKAKGEKDVSVAKSDHLHFIVQECHNEEEYV